MLNIDNIKTYADDWAYDTPIKLMNSPEILNEDVINQSIEMILATPRGSRLFNINFGSNFSLHIFDNMSIGGIEYIMEEAIDDIERWEDRITILRKEVKVNANIDTHTITLTIPYVIKRRGVKGEFSKIISA